jgi:hypothetical protein
MIEIPTWLAILPKNAGVNFKEFTSAIGINEEAMRFRIRNGSMGTPKPDFRMGRLKAGGKQYWKAATVRNHIRHLNRKEMESKL